MGSKKTSESEKREVRIVYLTTISFTIWAFLSGHIEYMKSKGFFVIGVSSPDEMLEEVSDRNKIPVYGIPISRKISPLSDLFTLFRLFWFFLKIKPAIVNMSTPKASFLGAIAAKIARVPIRIFLVRGLISENAKGFKKSFFHIIERLTSLLCNRTIFVSPSLLGYARCEKIVSKNEGIVLGSGMSNGIDTSRFDPENDEIEKKARIIQRDLNISRGKGGDIVLGFVGRLAKDKGILDLATVWSSLKDRFSNLYLILVGPWEGENSNLHDIRAKLEADPSVFSLGFVSDVVPYYKIMDVLLFPSHREGFPNAPMEAAAMTVPSLAYRISGCIDAIVNKKTGILVEAGDVDALIDAVSMLIRDPEMRSRLGEEGRKRCIKNFRPELIWEATYKEYIRLLREKGLRYHSRG